MSFRIKIKYRIILFILLMSVNVVASASASASANENSSSTLVSTNYRPELATQEKNIDQSNAIINDVKSKEPFINIQQERVWNFKSSEDSEQSTSEEAADLSWINNFINALSMIIEFALWMLPLIIVFYLHKHRAYWMSLIGSKQSLNAATHLPETLFGLDVRRDKLPDNIELFAQALWLENKKREAVGLLYRGALVYLFDNYHYTLPSGATEQDCIRYLETHRNALNKKESNAALNSQKSLQRFSHITDIWINIAYAHNFPTKESFLEVCADWNLIFTSNSLHE